MYPKLFKIRLETDFLANFVIFGAKVDKKQLKMKIFEFKDAISDSGPTGQGQN